MKKFFIIIMCAFLALLLPVQTLAADSVVYQMNVAFMDDISDLSKCIIIEADSLNETKRIDTQTMNRIKSLKGTNKEKALEIFNNMEIQFFHYASPPCAVLFVIRRPISSFVALLASTIPVTCPEAMTIILSQSSRRTSRSSPTKITATPSSF